MLRKSRWPKFVNDWGLSLSISHSTPANTTWLWSRRADLASRARKTIRSSNMRPISLSKISHTHTRPSNKRKTSLMKIRLVETLKFSIQIICKFWTSKEFLAQQISWNVSLARSRSRESSSKSCTRSTSTTTSTTKKNSKIWMSRSTSQKDRLKSSCLVWRWETRIHLMERVDLKIVRLTSKDILLLIMRKHWTLANLPSQKHSGTISIWSAS